MDNGGRGPEGIKPRIKEMSDSMTNFVIIVRDLVDGRGVDGRLARTWHLEDWYGFFPQVGQAPAVEDGNQ